MNKAFHKRRFLLTFGRNLDHSNIDHIEYHLSIIWMIIILRKLRRTVFYFL